MAAVTPNKHLQALLEGNRAFNAHYEQEKDDQLTHLLNGWANVYAKDPAGAYQVLDLILQERGIKQAAAY